MESSGLPELARSRNLRKAWPVSPGRLRGVGFLGIATAIAVIPLVAHKADAGRNGPTTSGVAIATQRELTVGTREGITIRGLPPGSRALIGVVPAKCGGCGSGSVKPVCCTAADGSGRFRWRVPGQYVGKSAYRRWQDGDRARVRVSWQAGSTFKDAFSKRNVTMRRR
jgi:hypothetical protein